MHDCSDVNKFYVETKQNLILIFNECEQIPTRTVCACVVKWEGKMTTNWWLEAHKIPPTASKCYDWSEQIIQVIFKKPSQTCQFTILLLYYIQFQLMEPSLLHIMSIWLRAFLYRLQKYHKYKRKAKHI